jgi:uncharacterized protein RhaS with RHS repeats
VLYEETVGLSVVRDNYSPDLGRFISRDPLGYAAGDINLYRFVGNGPYGGLDPMGLAEIKKRPLDFCPLLGNSPILDFLDAEVLHEQIFFQDSIGGNIGFFQDISDTPSTLGVIRPDKTENLSTYYESTTQGGFDDCVMRLAVDATPEQNYSLLGIGRLEKFNCQDWVSNVKAKYYELEKLDWVKSKCNLKNECRL